MAALSATAGCGDAGLTVGDADAISAVVDAAAVPSPDLSMFPSDAATSTDFPPLPDLGSSVDFLPLPDLGRSDDLAVADVAPSPDLSIASDLGPSPDLAPAVKLPTFFTAPRYEVEGAPDGIAAGDLDGDGRPDLVVTFEDGGPGALDVLLSNGGAAFAPPVRYQAGPDPREVALGDLNGDGKLDIAVTNQVGGVSVLLNDGKGALGPAATYGLASETFSIAIGDLNGDGRLDVAAAYGLGVAIFLNLGKGVLAAPVVYPAGQEPFSIVVGDLNGDGWADVAVSDGSGKDVYVLRNKGKGAFAPAVGYTAGPAPTYMVGTDVDGDGKLDLAVEVLGQSVAFALLMNQGNGAFGAPINVTTTPDDPYGGPQVTGDFDGDGKPDLALIGDLLSGEIAIFSNQGKGAFTPSLTGYIAGSSPSGAAAADLDGDGKIDLAVCNYGSNDVSVLLNLGAGTFAAALEHEEAGASSVAVGDLDGDGSPDVAVAGVYSGVGVFLNQGKGVFESATDCSTKGNVPYSTSSVAIADLDGDGKPDLAAANPDSGIVAVLLNGGKGAFLPAINYWELPAPRAVVAADFDGDGRIDLAETNHLVADPGSGVVEVLFNQGKAVFGAPVEYFVGGQQSSLAVADVNGDGRPDLAFTNRDGNTMSVLINSGKGMFAPPVDFPTGPAPVGLALADVDGDGRPDAVIAAGTEVDVLLNQGKGVFAPLVSYAPRGIVDKPASTPAAVAVGDLDGDGKPDIATGDNYLEDVAVLVNNGDGTFTDQVVVSIGGSGPHAIALADLNGDGLNDLAIANGDGCAVLMNTTR